MVLNLVVSNRDVADAVGTYFTMTLGKSTINNICFGQSSSVSSEIMIADLWIIEAMHKYGLPEGFQLAMKLAGTRRFLLMFSVIKPIAIPDEGDFWTVFHSKLSLKDKIYSVLERPIPHMRDLNKLSEAWSLLGKKNNSHHC